MQPRFRGLEQLRQAPELIPNRLRRDRESRPLHLLALALEGHRVHVLRDRRMNREAQAVTTAGNNLVDAERRVHVATSALVLVTPVLASYELDFDDFDLLAFVVLTFPLGKSAPTARAT